ncbi:unnamed protein product [Rotaria magnacalcarata]
MKSNDDVPCDRKPTTVVEALRWIFLKMNQRMGKDVHLFAGLIILSLYLIFLSIFGIFAATKQHQVLLFFWLYYFSFNSFLQARSLTVRGQTKYNLLKRSYEESIDDNQQTYDCCGFDNSTYFNSSVTREEYRQQKELEELRKAGSTPAEVDEEGKDINLHIPKYMTDMPWYVTYDHETPTLKHQRLHQSKIRLLETRILEWPRPIQDWPESEIGLRHIHPEKSKEYDTLNEWYARGYTDKVATRYRPGACENCGAMTHKRLAEAKKVLKAKKLDEEALAEEQAVAKMPTAAESTDPLVTVAAKPTESDSKNKALKVDSDDDEENGEYKYADSMDIPGQHVDSKQRISVRNLPYYDPKSRSMRDNPFAGTNKDPSQVPYLGDNFVRYSGDAKDFARSQIFAWEASGKCNFMRKKEQFIKTVEQQLIERYGGEEYLNSIPRELVVEAQTEQYVEFNRLGTIVEEKEIEFEANDNKLDDNVDQDKPKSLVELHRETLNKEKNQPKPSSSTDDNNSVMKKLDKKKVQEAARQLAERERQAEEMGNIDERKRKYNSLKSRISEHKEPTEEELEAYRLKKTSS